MPIDAPRALQHKHMAQRRSAQNAAAAFPYLMFVAVDDPRTHPSHMALNGCIWRKDDSVWNILYPPLGEGCRCRTRALTEGQLQREKLTALQPPEILREAITSGEIRFGLRFVASDGERRTVWIEME